MENLSEEWPAVGYVCNKKGDASFSDVPKCPHRREGLCERVVFVQDCGENLFVIFSESAWQRRRQPTTKIPSPKRPQRMSFLGSLVSSCEKHYEVHT